MSCCQGTIPALFLVGSYRYTHVMLSMNNPRLVPRTVHTGIHMSCCQGTIPALFLVRFIQVYTCHVVNEQSPPCSSYGSYRYTHVMLSRNIPALFLVRFIQVYTCHVVKEQSLPCSSYGAYRYTYVMLSRNNPRLVPRTVHTGIHMSCCQGTFPPYSSYGSYRYTHVMLSRNNPCLVPRTVHTGIHMSCCQGTIPALFLVRCIQVYTYHVVKEQSPPCSSYGSYMYTHVMLSRNNPCFVPRTVHTGRHMSCCQGTIPAYMYTHVMLSRNNPCLVPRTVHTGRHMSCCQGTIPAYMYTHVMLSRNNPALFLVRCIQVDTCHVVKEQSLHTCIHMSCWQGTIPAYMYTHVMLSRNNPCLVPRTVHTGIHISCCQVTIPGLFLVRCIQVYTCHVVNEQSPPCSSYGSYRYTHVMLSMNNPRLVPRTVHTGIHMSCCQGTVPALFLVRCIQVYTCHVVKEQFLPCSLYGSYRYTHVMLSRNSPRLVPRTVHTGIHMPCCQ